MVKAYRSLRKTLRKAQTRRYWQLRKMVVELAKRDGEVTYSKFAEFEGKISISSAGLWLRGFEADNVLKLTSRRMGGEKVYKLVD